MAVRKAELRSRPTTALERAFGPLQPAVAGGFPAGRAGGTGGIGYGAMV